MSEENKNHAGVPGSEPEQKANAPENAGEPLAKESIAGEAGKGPAETGAAAPERAQAIAGNDEAALAARRKAAEEARAARAAAAKAAAADGAAAGGGEAPPASPKEPSPNQPKLDRLVRIITEKFGPSAVVESYINELDRHLPCVVVDPSVWADVAALLRDHEELKLEYLRNMTGVDQETHMEVAYFMLNLAEKQDYCVKVKTDRDNPEIPSVVSVWQTANWNEREIYDLLGIRFTGHPDLRRIMLPDDWVGHPLRKDYVPLDPEV